MMSSTEAAAASSNSKQVRICPSVKSDATDGATDGSNPKRRPSVFLNTHRRRSSFLSKPTALSNLRRLSMATSSDIEALAKIRQQNTYRIEPNPENKFVEAKVKTVVYEYLCEELANVQYNDKDWSLKTRDISDQLKNFIKSLGFLRYKLVIVVLICPKGNNNDLIFGSRCLSDPSRDKTVTVLYSNDSLTAVVCVYAMYYD
ncbi:tctex1 domain-containing protein 2-like [Argonauta hians]